MLVFSAGALTLAPAAHADTTVLSESFESSSGLPDGWKLTTFTAGVSTATISTGSGADGTHFLKIVSSKANHARVVFPVTVIPGASYHFQAQAKSSGSSASTAAAVLGVDGQLTVTDSVRSSDSWQPLDLYVTVANQTTLDLTMGLGNFGQLNEGEADFDAVTVTEIASVPTDAKTVLALDPTAAGSASAASAAAPAGSSAAAAPAPAPASTDAGHGPLKSILVLLGFLVALVVVISAFLTLRRGPDGDATPALGSAGGNPIDAAPAPVPVPAPVEKTHFLDAPAGR